MELKHHDPVFAKNDIILWNAFLLPGGAMQVFGCQSGCIKDVEYFSLSFCTLMLYIMQLDLQSVLCVWHWYRQWRYNSEKVILMELTNLWNTVVKTANSSRLFQGFQQK